MKKAMLAMLAVFIAFILIIIGMLIGRSTIANEIVFLNSGQQDIPRTSMQEYEAAVQQEKTGKININTATVTQLQMLPNIGETLAQRIIDYRNTHGDFKSVEDITLVEGIGQKRLDEIREFITVGG